jgi:hypothetical protein
MAEDQGRFWLTAGCTAKVHKSEPPRQLEPGQAADRCPPACVIRSTNLGSYQENNAIKSELFVRQTWGLSLR